MVIELVGPPGSGKTYISKNLYKDCLHRNDIQKFRSLHGFSLFIVCNLSLIITLSIEYIKSDNRNRIKNIFFESYLLYIIKYNRIDNVVLDQSVMQSVSALFAESNGTARIEYILDGLLEFYMGIVNHIVYIKSDHNIERISKRRVNNCSFNIHDQEIAEDNIKRYYSFMDHLCLTHLAGIIDVKIIKN